MKPFPSLAFAVKNSINPLQINLLSIRVFICLLLITQGLSASVDNNILNLLSDVHRLSFYPQDTAKNSVKDSLSIDVSNKSDTTISKDAITSKVSYTADDSMKIDLETEKVFLWKNAEVHYQDVTLKADYIELDLKNNLVFADGLPDSTGKMSGMPVFKDGVSEYEAGKMTYNFKTKKGTISEVKTQEGDGFIKGNEVRKTPTDVIYVKDGYYTTCNLDEPHYSLATHKLKVIPGEKIVAGPTVLKIGDVPTPLGLPFGIFPNTKGRASGILIPSYGDSPSRGFFLTDAGYYLGISEHFDLSLTADVYSKGSYGFNLISNYKTRYKYNGRMDLSYNRFLNSYPEFPDFSESRDFFVRWNHSQDPKARPSSSFSASINAGTSSNFDNDINSRAIDYLSNVFVSNISYTKSFPGKPFNFTASARHNQNTQTGHFHLSLPDVSFNVNRLMPFQNSLKGGRAWKNLGISYSGSATNQLKTNDSLLSLDNLDKIKDDFTNGVRHSIPISTSMKVFKYFSLNPSISYSETWAFKSIRRNMNEEGIIQKDTVSEFIRGGNVAFSTGLNTKIYGMYQFHKGKINAIRHVITPQIYLNYIPEQRNGLMMFSDTAGKVVEYSIFENSIYSRPDRERSGRIGFNLMNNLEMKVRSDKDTSGLKKIKIFESLNLNSSYNVAADSLKFSNIEISGRTRLSNFINFQFDGSFDPYALDSLGRKYDKSHYAVSKNLARLTNANFAINFTLQGGSKKITEKKSELASEEQMDFINNNPEAFVDFNIPWSLRVSYVWRYSKPEFKHSITQTFNFSGEVKLTENWKMGFTSGWDIEKSDFSYTSINIYRNLHCWEMSINWIPFGPRQSYVFTLNVKSPVLQDLKLNRRRNYFDAIR